MKEVVFDIEANGLLDTISKIWVIACVDANGENEKIFADLNVFSRKKAGSLIDGVKYLTQADRIICHNFMGYDYHVLEMFYPRIWNRKTVPFRKVWDTLTQSRCQHFSRPRIKGVQGNHGLAYYGLLFKYPKPPIEDWSYWDEEKLDRVLVDIEINRKAYHYLNNEADETGVDFVNQIRRTQVAQYWYTKQEMHGTYGDREMMEDCIVDLDIQLEDLRKEIEPNLPPMLKVKTAKCTWENVRDKWDGFFRRVPRTKYDAKGSPIKPAYMPTTKFTVKGGKYDRHTLNHFSEWLDKWPDSVVGAYTKFELVPTKMTQHAEVKKYLLKLGWKPTQWNYEKGADGKFLRTDNGNLIKKSPKLTEDSFDSIEGDLGQNIALYNTLMHRRRTIQNEKSDEKGWLNQLREDGRISSGCQAWATETGRGAQNGIVNVPSVNAVYGKPMRSVWTCPDDKVLVSVDMDSAQIRLLANYMKDDEYTQAVVSGVEFDDQHNYVGTDPHTLNAMAFGTLDEGMVVEARETQDKDLIEQIGGIRKLSKNGFYCVPMDTMALCKDGWKHYEDIKDGDMVLGYDPEDGTKKWTRVVGKKKFSDAEVFEFGHNSLKLRATADHRWFVKQRVDKTPSGFNRSMKMSVHQIRTTAELNTESSIIMNAPMNEHCDNENCLTPLGENKWDVDWVSKVLNMSQMQRKAFLEGFMIADGTFDGSRWSWSQNDGVLYEAALLASYLVHDGVVQVSGRKPYEHVIKCAKLSVKSHRGFATGTKKSVGKQDVWCIQTELGSWVMRQNDTITITGNCLLFGGGDEKLATTLKMRGGAAAGKAARNQFMERLEGANTLTKKLKKQWKENTFRRGGYIEVAGDTWVWCGSEHKLLNYLLMGSEAALQNHAICWVNNEMIKRKLEGNQILSIHDEITFEFDREHEEDGVKLLTEMYGVASKQMGLDVLVTGTAQAGKRWSEIH